MKEWIKTQAWGHHASCTCRIGSDPWQGDVANLKDKDAVLDSRFRVHGVRGLRIVDASVFPKIPGYFIVTPVFMISEKAADTILADTQKYPEPLRISEVAAVNARRKAAFVESNPHGPIGLALSGGGIRSATFCLGILQALATKTDSGMSTFSRRFLEAVISEDFWVGFSPEYRPMWLTRLVGCRTFWRT